MGMGEPLHNYDETMRRCGSLADEHGFDDVAARRMQTLSTVGLAAGARATTGPGGGDAEPRRHDRCTRRPGSSCAPANWCRSTGAYGVGEIIAACPQVPALRSKRSRITFETRCWLVQRLSRRTRAGRAKLVAGVKAKVNLIPPEPPPPGIPCSKRTPSDVGDRSVRAHRRRPLWRGFAAGARAALAGIIRAACGQLIVEGPKKSAASAARRHVVDGSA
mgnify:CR=1 FL=1